MAAITLLSLLLFGSLVFDCTALEVCDFHTGDVLNVNANANIKLTIRNYIKWNRYHSGNGMKVGWLVGSLVHNSLRSRMTLRFRNMDKLLYDQVSLSFLPNTLKIKRAHRSAT